MRSCAVVVTIIAVFVLGGVSFFVMPAAIPVIDSVSLPNTYDRSPTAFTLNYPEDWIHQIPQAGTLIVASPSTLRGEVGPALVVRRSELLAAVDSLDEALDDYLNNGPLRPNRNWEIVEERIPVTVGGRDALKIELAGSEVPDAPRLHTRVFVARAGNGVVYFMAFSAPEEIWQATLPTIDAITNSMVIIE